jgi:two-component system, OmpR family, response regulator MprA
MEGRRVLIVDDDTSVARVLVRIFEKAGFAAQAAHNGEQALALLQATRFDAMVCDIQMPRMDGKQLCHHLATEGPYFPDCVFIATSRADLTERSWLDDFPRVSLVEKPVAPRQLVALVTRRLGETAGEARAA